MKVKIVKIRIFAVVGKIYYFQHFLLFELEFSQIRENHLEKKPQNKEIYSKSSLSNMKIFFVLDYIQNTVTTNTNALA